MDEEVTAQFWISFFVEAGIPPAAAANYAIIFTDNRIQKHMLLDLNKEYLKDMGVNILGDIIAILKHAKNHHEKVAREKVLAADKEISVKKATKHLNEILSKEETVVTTPDPVPLPVKKPPQPAVQKPSPPKKIKIVKTETGRVIDEEAWYAEVEELKRKVIPPPKLAAAAPVTVPKKSSVFERLGEGSVTSTTPDTPSTSLKSSVFKRLGNVTLQEASVPQATPVPTSSVKLVTRKPITAIPAVTNPVRVTLEAKKPSMRMDTVIPTKRSAKERLGHDHNPSPIRTVTKQSPPVVKQKVISNRVVKQPVIVPQPKSLSTSRTVKQRLGVSSVFDRLGTNKKNTI